MIALLQRFLVLLCGCMLFATPASALEVVLVLSQAGGAHAHFGEALRAGLAVTGHRLIDGGNLEDGIDDERIARADLIVTSGLAAAAAMAQRAVAPTLAVLISRSQYLGLRRQYADAVLSAIVLDQPPERQLALMRALLPNVRSIGVLFGPETLLQKGDLREAADRAGLELVGKELSTVTELMPALRQTLESTDALLALADPLLTGSGAARSLLLSSYRYRRPIFAYSRAYVEAGALAAVFSSPGDVARDVADWLRELRGGALQLPKMRAPRYFDVAINVQVARALNLDVADAATVRARMREEVRP